MTKWKGPQVDGLTQSLINRIICCPYSAYIYLILGLEENKELEPNLIYGDCGHKGLEVLIDNLNLCDRERFPLACQAAKKHLDDNYPEAEPTFRFSLPRLLRGFRVNHHKGDWVAETEIDTQITPEQFPNLSQEVRIRGKVDGKTTNHPEYETCIGEHKFKGYTDFLSTRDELWQDLQLNLYMFIEGAEWVIYDIFKVPDTQKYKPSVGYSESPEDWVKKIYEGPVGSYGGFYPINQNRHKWIWQKPLYIPLEKQRFYWETTIIPIINKIVIWYEWVTQSGFDPDNPKYHNDIFYRMPVRHFDGRKTQTYKCDYHSYLIGQETIDDLRPVDSFYSELEEI